MGMLQINCASILEDINLLDFGRNFSQMSTKVSSQFLCNLPNRPIPSQFWLRFYEKLTESGLCFEPVRFSQIMN